VALLCKVNTTLNYKGSRTSGLQMALSSSLSPLNKIFFSFTVLILQGKQLAGRKSQLL